MWKKIFHLLFGLCLIIDIIDVKAEQCPPGYRCRKRIINSNLGSIMPRVLNGIELEPCPRGSFNPGGFDDCIPCEPGTYAAQSGQPYCIDCFKGHMCPNSSAFPEPCPEGTYNNLFRQTCCRVCPPGKYTLVKGMYQCDDCPPGIKCPARGKLACEMNDITATTSTTTTLSTTTTTSITSTARPTTSITTTVSTTTTTSITSTARPTTSTTTTVSTTTTTSITPSAIPKTSTSTTTSANVCAANKPCKNGGTCIPVDTINYNCLCAEYYYGNECEFMDDARDENIIINVFDRNLWPDVVAVIDITGSMQACAAAVTKWMKLAHSTTFIKMYVFFNDGDDKITIEKKIGATGGIYWSNSTDISEVHRIMGSARINGSGGDVPENDIEALIYGANICPNCSNIIHIADNGATPRDLILLPQLANKRIKVIPCQVSDGINPAMIDIARQTNGSLHTLKQDYTNLSAIRINQTTVIASYTYRLTENGFVRI